MRVRGENPDLGLQGLDSPLSAALSFLCSLTSTGVPTLFHPELTIGLPLGWSIGNHTPAQRQLLKRTALGYQSREVAHHTEKQVVFTVLSHLGSYRHDCSFGEFEDLGGWLARRDSVRLSSAAAHLPFHSPRDYRGGLMTART